MDEAGSGKCQRWRRWRGAIVEGRRGYGGWLGRGVSMVKRMGRCDTVIGHKGKEVESSVGREHHAGEKVIKKKER